MRRESGQALILVLILLAVGALLLVPTLELTTTVLKSRQMYGQFIKEDYAMDAANEYGLWRVLWEPGYAASLPIGQESDPFTVTINGITVNTTITAQATEALSGVSLVKDHQIKPTKTVTPNTASPGVPTTFTYTITMQRLEPDDAVFDPLEEVIDALPAGFVYVPDSSVLDGVPFADDDLTILKEPVIVQPLNTLPWSRIVDEDAMVANAPPPEQNYGTALTMKVSSGIPTSNETNARVFLKVDISSIPAGAVIQSANLTLWAKEYPEVARTYDLHRVTANWTETSIHWNNQPGIAASATASARTPSDNSTPMKWEVRNDIQAWLDGVTTNYGWRISDAAETFGTENFTDTVIDALEFDALRGKTPAIIPISGDIYAIAYGGNGDHGYLKTVQIAASGQITDTVIDTLEFDTQRGLEADLINVSGDIYAIAYRGGGDDGFLKTVEITSSGNITDTVIDTLEFDTLRGLEPDIINVSGDIYAIAYRGDGDDGFLKTVEITSSGNITDTVIDTLEFDTLRGKTPAIIPISGDIYAIAYGGDGDDGFLKTVQIASNGQITDTVIDSLEFDPLKGLEPDIINVSGDIYAIAYRGDGDDGFLATVEIASNGQITDAVIDTLEFDTLQGKTPAIVPLSSGTFVIAYWGDGDDGFLETVAITPSGRICQTLLESPEFDTVRGKSPDIINISGDVYAIAYTGGPTNSDHGYLKTVDIVLSNYVNHITEFRSKDDDSSNTEPELVVSYIPLGGSDFQKITWRFDPPLDFTYGQKRTLSFQARAVLPDNSRHWNAVELQPDGSWTGLTANITVGTPSDNGTAGAGIRVTKTSDTPIVYAGVPTIVTYVISITNIDIGGFDRLDAIEDYLPPGFSYVVGSASAAWPDLNSTDNPQYPYNIGDFEPEVTPQPDGRLKLKWHRQESANGFFPGVELLHDYPMPQGVTYTQTFQALADVDVSGSYQNEVIVKLKDWNKYGDRGIGDKNFYSWPTGTVIVPAYDLLSETELSALRTNAALTGTGIEVKSWHWKKHK
ncbi:MAG TPA: DNRLRE domain-containing protein [Dehalococcoidia bacterium]|nr:DNRLRE domain-containing protein [Dehalococcoidia bacterium]